MGEFNIPPDQQTALGAIDASELARLIDLAVDYERSDDLRHLPLTRCGSYVAKQLSYFEQALAKCRLAKAPRKREETRAALRRAASDLTFAVSMMKRRIEEEQKDAQIFWIYDRSMPPRRFTKDMSVRVDYRWRQTVDEEWKFGSITFIHDVDLRPNYAAPTLKRRPSRAKREQELQERFFRIWEHLTDGALYSVREYFRKGGNGGDIPDSFQTTVDSHSGEMNNYSTQFWR